MLGSTALMQVALGKTEADEYKGGLHKLSEMLRGTVGLFFTKLPHEEVRCACATRGRRNGLLRSGLQGALHGPAWEQCQPAVFGQPHTPIPPHAACARPRNLRACLAAGADGPLAQVKEAFDNFVHEDFARAGAKAVHDFRLTAGPLSGPAGPLPHTLEPQLRKFGMPTKLNKGVVELLADYTVGNACGCAWPRGMALWAGCWRSCW